MKWIETSQRMPRHQKVVLFLYKDIEGTEPMTGWFDEKNNEWVSIMVSFFRDLSEKAFEDSHFEPSKVKYWINLPRTPEKMEAIRKKLEDKKNLVAQEKLLKKAKIEERKKKIEARRICQTDEKINSEK